MRRIFGSPPRVRGTDPALLRPCHSRWITPACAGNRSSFTVKFSGQGDHPRVCGEQCNGSPEGGGAEGSPPRVRGTGRGGAGAPGIVGITPACAGKSSSGSLSSMDIQDHPRVCGEKAPAKPPSTRPYGSPPRVRGKVPRLRLPDSHRGITPACAGNRPGDTIIIDSDQDHPRVCGEQPMPCPDSRTKVGSPPRVRGTDWPPKKVAASRRITPACAGNSRRDQVRDWYL